MDELEALRKENAEQRLQIASLTAQITQLVTELARLNERVSELLAVAQRKQRKAPAPAFAPPAAPPSVEGEARRAFDERPKAPDKPEKESLPKKKVKPTGRKPVPGHLEAEEHELRPDACSACGGGALDVVDKLDEEKLHVVKETPAPARRTALYLPLPRVWRAHDASLPACPLRALQDHLRVARLARVSEVLVAHSARSDPA